MNVVLAFGVIFSLYTAVLNVELPLLKPQMPLEEELLMRDLMKALPGLIHLAVPGTKYLSHEL